MTATLAKKGRTVKDWLDDESFQQHLMRILPKHVRADQFLSLAMTSVKKTPKLRECTVPSMVAALVTAARLGLSIDGPAGGAYLVPFNNKRKVNGKDVWVLECQLMPDYRGLQKLARQTQDVKQISACVVYDGDEFSFQRGTDPKIHHIPKPWPDGREPKITHCYAVAWWRGEAMPQFEVMQYAEIEKVRASAKSGDSLGWTHWWGEMGKKTVFKRLGKWLPSSAELLKAIALDDEAEAGLPQTLDYVVDVEAEPSTPKAAPRAKSPPATTVDDEPVAKQDQDGAAAKGSPPKSDAEVSGAAPDSQVSDEAYKLIAAAFAALPEAVRDTLRSNYKPKFKLITDVKQWTVANAEDFELAIKKAGTKPTD